MTRILGISGSLRQTSFNTALLRTAQGLMPEGATLEEGSIRGIPLYDADEEAQAGIPPAVETLKEQIAAADGVLLFTPEYNNSIPGVFKNAIDWTSRPAGDIARVFGARPMAVIGASPGGFGTILSQDAWLSVLRTLGTRPWYQGRLMVARAESVFDEAGIMGSGQNMGVIFVVAARAKVSSLRVGLPWTYGLQSKLPSTTGRSALISLTAFHDPTG